MRRSFVMAANIATTAAVRPTVIFLHGSGDTGRGVEGWLRSLAPPDALAPFDWDFLPLNPFRMRSPAAKSRACGTTASAASSHIIPNRPNLLKKCVSHPRAH